jgi:parallel beta-helix repeat protein
MRTRRPLAAFFVLTLAFFAIAAGASAAAQTTIHIPADQPTIQAGIDAAHNGDTVLVSPGTYYENIDFKGKAITLTSSAGPAITTIDGGGNGPAVTFKTSEPRSAVLSNLTIQHGGNFETFSRNTVTFETGGIQIGTSTPTVLNNIITLNNCWGIHSAGAGPLIQGNTISATQDPHGQCSFGGGSGIYISGDFVTTPPSSNNVPAAILRNTIENNVESGIEDAGGNGGGAITIWGGGPLIEDNILRNNSSPGGSGGAINIQDGGGKGTFIIQNLIYGNSAGCGGGAIAFNTGFVSPPGFDVLVANNTIIDNTGQSNAGYSECTNISQLYPSPDSYGEGRFTAVFVNNIVSGSTAYPAVNCSWFGPKAEWQQPIFDHNILNNAGGAFFGSFCIDTSTSYGNITTAPQFIDRVHGNFQLAPTSPGIDAGNNSVLQSIAQYTGVPLTSDFSNNPRVQDATAKGYPVIDMGAYELGGTVDANPTTIILTSSAYFGNAGSNYVLTANLASAAGVPTGSVDFYLDGKMIGSSTINSSGVASLSNFTMPPGSNNLYASYPGQGGFPPATSVIIIVDINLYSTNISLTSSQNPSLVGQPVTFTVKVSSGDPSSTPSPITLTDGFSNTTLATLIPDSSGTATYTTSALALGLHPIGATYAGDKFHNGATASVYQQVVSGYSTSTILASSLNPDPYGQSVTFTATVTNSSTNPGAPTGAITFSDGATVLATQPLVTGSGKTSSASLSTGSLSVGTHPITATYTPAGSFAPSSGSLSQIITGFATNTALASSLNPANITQSVTFTATVTTSSSVPGGLTGSVNFYDGATLLTNVPIVSGGGSSGTASFSTSSLAAGVHTIAATFTSLAAFASSSAQVTQTINKLSTATALTALPNPALFGTGVTITAALSGSPTTPAGNVTFYDGTTMLAVISLDASGHAALTTSTLAVGMHTLFGVYAGDPIYVSSTSAPFTEVIQPLPQDFSITLASPSITIKTEHHTTTTLTLSSINGFADSLAIACANLTQYVTCQPKPTPATLTASASTTVSLYLDTDSVLGYARLTAPAPPAPRSVPVLFALLFAPFSLFGALALSRKSRRTPLRLLTLLFTLAPLSLALSGCTTIIGAYDPPAAAAPGTYTIPITATGAATHVSHTANLTLTITP